MSESVSTISGPPQSVPLFDVAVVIATVLRPSLERAVQSVFQQKFNGRIQILVGVDKHLGDLSLLDRLRRQCPANCALTVLDPGYSTAVRNGGLYPEGSGGALRTILSYLAHSRRVAYLDDDNYFARDHLATLCEALGRAAWAYSLRCYADPETGKPLCVDQWESLGPGKGVYHDVTAGFVDTSSLILDKITCESVLRYWCHPLANDPRHMSADRHVLYYLSTGFRGLCTGKATSFYTLHADDIMHTHRLAWIEEAKKQGTIKLPPEAILD